jgi:hypothetical protein
LPLKNSFSTINDSLTITKEILPTEKRKKGRSDTGFFVAWKKWVEAGFLEIVDPSLKSRKYSLAGKYKELLSA